MIHQGYQSPWTSPLVQVITISVGVALHRPIGIQYNYMGLPFTCLTTTYGRDSEGSYILTQEDQTNDLFAARMGPALCYSKTVARLVNAYG